MPATHPDKSHLGKPVTSLLTTGGEESRPKQPGGQTLIQIMLLQPLNVISTKLYRGTVNVLLK